MRVGRGLEVRARTSVWLKVWASLLATLKALVAALIIAVSATASVAWIVDSHSMSGPVLVTLTQQNGIHLHDWVSFAILFIGGVFALPLLVEA